MSLIFFLLALVGAGSTFVALVRVRHPTALSVFAMMPSWLVGEAPLHILGFQVVGTVVFVLLGALDGTLGQIGLVITVVSWVGMVGIFFFALATAKRSFEQALVAGLGGDYRSKIEPELLDPIPDRVPLGDLALLFHHDKTGIERIRDIPYGEAGKRNLLDVFKPAGDVSGCPVLLQIHGGAWVIGQKEQQAMPLMHTLTRLGYVCVTINYRLSPRASFPDHLIDVKKAIAWIRANIADYGGDASFLAVTGGSAGGHLASLAATTANDPRLQPGFEEVDTSVSCCVPFYGAYDFTNSEAIRGRTSDVRIMLEPLVMKQKQADDPEMWRLASPILLLEESVPPFFVIHGKIDVLLWIEETRAFVAKLSSISQKEVVYAEVPAAQHAFDLFNSVRSINAANAVARFLAYMRSTNN
jgi:acetyl esterase/lipase